MSWKKVILEQICDINMGKTPSRNKPEYWGGKNTWVAISDLKGETFISKTKEGITDLALKETGIKSVEKGTLLYSFKLSIGKVAITEKQLYTNEAIVARPIKDSQRVYLKYLYYAIQMVDLTGIGDKAVKGITLNKEKLKQLPIPLPPLPIQKQIADTLDKADALRRKDQLLLQKYDELAESIFYDMFGDPSTSDRFMTLGELAQEGKHTFSNGPFGSDLLTSELTHEGVPVVYIRDIRNGYFRWKSDVYVTEAKSEQLISSKVIPGDILIAKVGDPPGIAAVYPENLPNAIITQDVIRFRPKKELLLSQYFQYYLNSNWGKRILEPIIVEGTRSRFGLGDFKKLKIGVPNIKKQADFVRQVELIMKSKNLINTTNSDSLFQTLSQKAFNNELVA